MSIPSRNRPHLALLKCQKHLETSESTKFCHLKFIEVLDVLMEKHGETTQHPAAGWCPCYCPFWRYSSPSERGFGFSFALALCCPCWALCPGGQWPSLGHVRGIIDLVSTCLKPFQQPTLIPLPAWGERHFQGCHLFNGHQYCPSTTWQIRKVLGCSQEASNKPNASLTRVLTPRCSPASIEISLSQHNELGQNGKQWQTQGAVAFANWINPSELINYISDWLKAKTLLLCLMGTLRWTKPETSTGGWWLWNLALPPQNGTTKNHTVSESFCKHCYRWYRCLSSRSTKCFFSVWCWCRTARNLSWEMTPNFTSAQILNVICLTSSCFIFVILFSSKIRDCPIVGSWIPGRKWGRYLTQTAEH